MLKTTDQQNSEPLSSSNKPVVPITESLPTLSKVENLKLEPEGLENIQALVDVFTSETKRRKRRFWISWTAAVCTIAPIFGLISYLIVRAPSHYLPMLIGPSLLLAFISFGLPFSAMALVRPTKKQRSIIETLIASNDVRAVDPLMTGIGTSNRKTRDLMVAALIALLPRLKESDDSTLSAATHRAMVFIAGWANSGMMRKQYGKQWVDFAISDLKALANVGDRRALRPVTALANGAATAGDMQRIQQAAIECLEPLRKRIERDSLGEHLLRSSALPTSSVDTLLIPATEPPADPNELPRPSAKG